MFVELVTKRQETLRQKVCWGCLFILSQAKTYHYIELYSINNQTDIIIKNSWKHNLVNVIYFMTRRVLFVVFIFVWTLTNMLTIHNWQQITNILSSLMFAISLTISEPLAFSVFHFSMQLCRSAAPSFSFRALPVRFPWTLGELPEETLSKVPVILHTWFLNSYLKHQFM